MPTNPRPLSPMNHGTGTYDSPPASSGPPSPYPDRHSRLRRALRNTSELAQEIARDTPVSVSQHAEGEAFSRVEAGGRREEVGYAGAAEVAHEAGHEGGSVRLDSAGRPRETITRAARDVILANANRRRRRDVDDEAGREDGEGDDYGLFSGDYRRKRRKLDDETPARAIRYGHFGQVEAGKLRMKVTSNDGGEHTDPRHPEIYLGADNMLRLDKSVFCSARSSAGVILQHADGTAFCLEKLHIVGPEHGFTAPVREGLVYVSMDIKALQPYLDPPYHARRSGIHEPPYRPRTMRASPERLSLVDALHDPEISAAASHHSAYSSGAPDPWSEHGMYSARLDPELHCEHEHEHEHEPTSPNLSSSSDTSLPFTLLSDEECGPEDSSTQEVIDYRLRRMRLMQRRLDFENYDRAERWGGISNARLSESERERHRERDYERERIENPWGLHRLDPLLRRSRRQSPPPEEKSASFSLEEGVGDPNVTMARFQIKSGKHKVAIKFDPPVSGRYVLLKMWSGRSNVDVQSVVAKGYAGPRFFPALRAL